MLELLVLWIYYSSTQMYLILHLLYEEISSTTCLVFHKCFQNLLKENFWKCIGRRLWQQGTCLISMYIIAKWALQTCSFLEKLRVSSNLHYVWTLSEKTSCHILNLAIGHCTWRQLSRKMSIPSCGEIQVAQVWKSKLTVI